MDDQNNASVSDFMQGLQKSPTTTAEPEASESAAPVASNEPAESGESAESAESTAQSTHANKIRIITKALRAMEQNIGNIIRLLEEDAPSVAITSALSGDL